MQSFIKKYEPSTCKDIIGQEKALTQLKQYVKAFQKFKSKAALVYGPTGCGKTISVHALAKECNFEVLEINASDVRNKASIHELLGAAIKQQSLFCQGKIILLDEIDGLSGTKDRGCLSEVSSLLKESAFPIICTALDPSDKKFKAIRKHAELIPYEAVDHTVLADFLETICKKENIVYDATVLPTLARMSGGDVRAALNDLQIIIAGLDKNETLNKEHLSTLGDREGKTEMQEALLRVFKTTDVKIALSAFHNLSLDLGKSLLWVEENIPYEYEKIEDRARAFDFVAQADIMQRRIMRWQHWRFLVYVSAYLSGGVAVAKDEKYKKMIEYKETRRLLKIWQANMKHLKKKSMCEKIAGKTHTSTTEVFKDVFPFIHSMCRNDKELCTKFAEEFGLSDDEVGWLER